MEPYYHFQSTMKHARSDEDYEVDTIRKVIEKLEEAHDLLSSINSPSIGLDLVPENGHLMIIIRSLRSIV